MSLPMDMAAHEAELLRFMEDAQGADADGAAPSLEMMPTDVDMDELLTHLELEGEVAPMGAAHAPVEHVAVPQEGAAPALNEEDANATALLDELLETSEDLLARLSDDSADVARRLPHMSWDADDDDGDVGENASAQVADAHGDADMRAEVAALAQEIDLAAFSAPPPPSPMLTDLTSDSSYSSVLSAPATPSPQQPSQTSSSEIDAATLRELMNFTPSLELPQDSTHVARSPDCHCSTDEEAEFDVASDIDKDKDDEMAKQQQQQPQPMDEEEEQGADEDEDANMHELDLLQKESKYLEAQFDYLLSRSRRTRTSIKAKRRHRARAQLSEDTAKNDSMRQLVAQQKVFLENFRSMLAFAPVSDIRLALMTPIESYIHLGKDFHERRRTILALREEKLDMTYKYIEEKAAGIDWNQPYQYSDVFERFGKYYSVHFAISKYDGVDVRQVVKVVYDQMAGTDDQLSKAMGCMQIRESYDQIKCNFLHQRIVSSLRWSDAFEEGFPELESNSLFLCRFAGDTAVFATDYIDQDDLHPYMSTQRVRKDVSSGVVLSAQTSPDGKKSVIMKRFLLTKFHVHPHNIPDKVAKILMSGVPVINKNVQSIIDKRLHASKNLALPASMTCCPTMPPTTECQCQDSDPVIPQQCG